MTGTAAPSCASRLTCCEPSRQSGKTRAGEELRFPGCARRLDGGRLLGHGRRLGDGAAAEAAFPAPRRGADPGSAPKGCASISTSAPASSCRRPEDRGGSGSRISTPAMSSTRRRSRRAGSPAPSATTPRARIEVFAGDRLVFSHDYDCRDKEVLIQLPVGTLGDSLGWFPYAAKFQRAHGCRLTRGDGGAADPAVSRRLSGDHLSHP